MTLHIHVVSFGKHQTPRKAKWWMQNSSTLTIRADKELPIFPHIDEQTTGLDPEVIRYFEEDIDSISAVVSLQIAILSWVRKKQKHQEEKERKHEEAVAKKKAKPKEFKVRELYIYMRDATGRIRSVYLANKIHTFLSQLGFSSNVHHLELSRKNPKK